MLLGLRQKAAFDIHEETEPIAGCQPNPELDGDGLV